MRTGMRSALCQLGNLSGLLAPVLWAGTIVYCGTLRPGFSHYAQYISELGERGSSTEFIMRYAGFVPTGLMHMAFAAFLWHSFRGQRLAVLGALLLAVNGVARMAAGLFPCEPGCGLPHLLLSQRIHTYAATVGFVAFIAATWVWGWCLWRDPRSRWFCAYSIATGCIALLFAVLTATSDATRAGTGLYERLSSGVLSLWVLMFALRLWRRARYRTSDQQISI